jgi:hypothetical protein
VLEFCNECIVKEYLNKRVKCNFFYLNLGENEKKKKTADNALN